MNREKLQWPAGWLRTPEQRKSYGSRFTYEGREVPYHIAYALLQGELSKLGATRVNISVDSDGTDNGVAVYFNLKGESRVMACDRYKTQSANIRSLGLAISAMRQLERHGGGALADRAFAGFTALPAPRSCWEILGIEPESDTTTIERAFRTKALTNHPDRGGSDKAMAELNAARKDALQQVTA